MNRTYEEILENMKSAYFNECGTVIEDNSQALKMFEILASELFSISCYGDFIFKQAFVQTATGENLDRLGELRGCIRKSAAYSSGELTFLLNEASDEYIIIPENTVCSVYGKPYMQFSTTQEGVIEAGETRTIVSAVSLSSGNDYNVSENTITVMVNAPIGVTAVTNEKPFEGGYSEERDTPYRNRILRHYGILPNGINCTSCENQVMTLDYVTDCRIVPSTIDNNMKIYVATKSNTLSEEQKSEIAEKIMIIDAARVNYSISLSKTSRYKLNVDAEIMTGFDEEKIRDKITNRLFEVSSGARIGECIYLSRFRKALNDIDGLIDVSFRADKIKGDAVMVHDNASLLLTKVEVNFINE